MLPGAYSGTLLEADLRGTGAPPAFLGEAAGAGAAADPAAFLVGGPETDVPGSRSGHLDVSMTAFAAAGSSARAHSLEGPGSLALCGMDGGSRATASDLLRSLDSGCDFLLLSEPLDVPMSLLGSPGPAASPPPVATSPGTPPSVPGHFSWPSLVFPTIPEEAELHAGPVTTPALVPPAASLPHSLPGSMAGHAAAPAVLPGPSPFTLPLLQQTAPTPPRLFMTMPTLATAPAPLAPPPAPPALAPILSGRSSAGDGSTSEESPSASSGPGARAVRSGASSAASGGSGRVPRPASMPNLHLNLTEAGSGAVRKKAAPRAPRTTSKSNGLPRSRSHSDLRGSGHTTGSAMAVVAATPAAADPTHLPHSAFLTPVHKRKGKGGRQPAADPRLDPNIDPKRAARIMANRLSAAKSKLKQKAQAEKQKAERRGQRSRQGLDEEMEDSARLEPEQHSQQMQDVEGQLASQHLRPPSA